MPPRMACSAPARTIPASAGPAQRRSIWVQKRIPVKLRVDHPDHGRAGDIIRVKPGYMRQILHPSGWATYKRGDVQSPALASTADDDTLRMLLLRIGMPAANLSTAMAKRRRQAETALRPDALLSSVQQGSDSTAALREALKTLALQQSEADPSIVFRMNARDGVLFGSVRDSMIVEAIVDRLNQLDQSEAVFNSSMLAVKAWTASTVGRLPAASQGTAEGRTIKSVGMYQVSVAPVVSPGQDEPLATTVYVLVTGSD